MMNSHELLGKNVKRQKNNETSTMMRMIMQKNIRCECRTGRSKNERSRDDSNENDDAEKTKHDNGRKHDDEHRCE